MASDERFSEKPSSQSLQISQVFDYSGLAEAIETDDFKGLLDNIPISVLHPERCARRSPRAYNGYAKQAMERVLARATYRSAGERTRHVHSEWRSKSRSE